MIFSLYAEHLNPYHMCVSNLLHNGMHVGDLQLSQTLQNG